MYSSLLVLLWASIAAAEWRWGPRAGKGKFGHLLSRRPATEPVPTYKHIYNGTFEQQLDHSDPSLGTFSQTFYYDTSFYKGAGYPIIMFAPQEANASEYLSLLTDTSLAGQLAQRVGGATVLMEHRYWGNSSPYSELTTDNMTYLTLENAIQDCTNFASNVVLPFAPTGSNADSVPWVLIGGSYSGALTAWVQAKAPGTFWAYLASSAVVETISDFWQYFAQVQYGMPQNCSSDVTLVIDYMDNLLATGSAQEIHDLKKMFGLETIEYNDDFMEALANGPYQWQDPDFFTPPGAAAFYEWCDYVENAVNVTDASALPGPEGVGLQKALSGYALWMSTVLLPGYCKEYGYYTGNYSTECFDTHNASNPMFSDTSLSNTFDRQWEWFLCHQAFGWWQDGAPKDNATIVSRLVNADYFKRQCSLYYPGIDLSITPAETNAYTGGWFIDNTTRLVYVSGEFDPWRDSQVQSFFRPGGPLGSTAQVPNYIVPEGNHCSDLSRSNALNNAGVAAVQESELSDLEAFIKEWPGSYTK